ncbi:MAG TPA: RluA family pseudouridine synthase, partial [Vicinamibacteria bacterium]
EGSRLDEVVGDQVARALGAAASRSAIRRLIMAGAVSAAGRPLRSPGRPLRAGTWLDVRVEPAKLAPPADAAAGWRITRDAILFADGALLAVDKPVGLPTTPTADPRRPSLVAAVQAHLAAAGAEPYVGVHQRLDRDTSGVVLFVTDRRANAALARQLTEGRVEKTYLALAARPSPLPPPAWEVSGPLGAGGPQAHTRFRRLEAHAHGLVIEARPVTGRKHQIRIQLASAGMPLLGDAAYGGPEVVGEERVPRAMLHAARLQLRHPLSGAPLTLESAPPADFARALAALRRPPRATRTLRGGR